jgi:transposase
MRNVLEILRLRLGEDRSEREVARSVGKARSTVADYVLRFTVAGLVWPLVPPLDEDALERLLFAEVIGRAEKAAANMGDVDLELRRKGVTLQLLWEEYAREHEGRAYQYSWFCERYQEWRRKQRISMRQVHVAGRKMFVDFSGDGLALTDPRTGERRRVELFVATLGASSMTYACATLDQTLASWVEGMTRALEAFGGVTELVVPDNPRALVTRVDRYAPDLNRTVVDWAEHYGTCVIPARPYKPKDKAKVEAAVLVAQRWVVAVLRNRVFHTITDINEAIDGLMERINQRVMKNHGSSRAQLFAALDAPALRPLPVNRFQFATWHKARVHPDYHVQVEKHFYSVPYIHRGQAVMVRVKLSTVEILLRGNCIATHSRSRRRFGHTTLEEHMPSSHKAMKLSSSVDELMRRAERVGPNVHALFGEMTRSRQHPEYAIRGMQGILALRHSYPDARVDAACARVMRFRTLTATSVRSILKSGLDQLASETTPQTEMPAQHQNLRGGSYFLN